MRMSRVGNWLKGHKPVVVLVVATVFLLLVPAIDIALGVGYLWRGILPIFTDENFYIVRVMTLVHGHTGNPYYVEHANSLPLVMFGGVWINALPFLLGLSLSIGLYANYIVWGFIFSFTAYVLFRELKVSAWVAVAGVLFLFAESIAHIWRAVNMQTVYPFYFLQLFALSRFIKSPTTYSAAALAVAVGAAFYLQGYFWQISVTTVGVLFLWSLFQKDWLRAKWSFVTGVLGCLIGAPVVLYTLWLSHASPFYWESMGRLGLVHTHIPTSEIFYSGGLVGAVLLMLAAIYRRVKTLRTDPEFQPFGLFLLVSGLGLWITQASNAITGIWLETGEHVRTFIIVWLVFAVLALGRYIIREWNKFSKTLKIFLGMLVLLLLVANGYFFYQYVRAFLPTHTDRASWQDQQRYAAVYDWLNAQPKNAVVWADPKDPITQLIPIHTNDFVLHTYFGMFELMPDKEAQERYLVSQYFDDPTAQDLQQYDVMNTYLGRHDVPHQAKTIEREVKVCRMLFFWGKDKNCGAIPTVQSLKGEPFFTDLAAHFKNSIKPNIQSYLEKYHVTYILRDSAVNPQYHPEVLGARKVYDDGRFEIYKR